MANTTAIDPGPVNINGVGSTGQDKGNKIPLATPAVPNPMHNYASWTYSWSLWWLDIGDKNNLMACDDVDAAQAYQLGPLSYVVAEDGGRFTDRRLPSQYGLNYQLQEVQLSTLIGLNQVSKHTNLATGSMTVVEPYGVTFIDTLADASWDPVQKKYINYTQQPFLLQIDFKGFDDNGQPIPDSETALYRKRYPISILSMKVAVSAKGAEYKIQFAPSTHIGQRNEHTTTPADFTVTAGTVAEFFTEFKNQWNRYYTTEVLTGRYQYADAVYFDIDDAISSSSIVNKNEAPLTWASTKDSNLVLDKLTWSIPKGTSVMDLIARVIVQSDWLINTQLGLEKANNNGNQTDPTNLFKTVVKTLYEGVDYSGAIQSGVYDKTKSRRPMSFTYVVHQYTSWKGSHPSMKGTIPDTRPWVVKYYNYLYTGKNTDIVDLKINFDTTYYTAINTYNRQIAASQSSAATGDENKLLSASTIALTPEVLSGAITPLSAVKTLGQMRIKHINGDVNNTSMLNGTRPSAQVAADVLKSAYSGVNGDMVAVKLTIVGDPTLLKQDDWLYVPSPTKSTSYNSRISQFDFVKKYGHLRMDNAELVVQLIINTPIDIDTDYYNNGLAFPAPNTMTSLFSGAYTITRVESTFNAGKFEQVLHLARYINTDYIEFFSSTKAAQRGAVGNVQDKAIAETGTNAIVGNGTSQTVTPGRT